MTRFEEIGGEPALRAIVDAFVDRCFDDPMIGFFFRRGRAGRDRIKRFEYEHAAEWLGADVRYSGRPLAVAHGEHRIMGGQFLRRLAILREVLDEHGVSEDLREAWIAHQESLRDQITGDPGGVCRD